MKIARDIDYLSVSYPESNSTLYGVVNVGEFDRLNNRRPPSTHCYTHMVNKFKHVFAAVALLSPYRTGSLGPNFCL